MCQGFLCSVCVGLGSLADKREFPCSSQSADKTTMLSIFNRSSFPFKNERSKWVFIVWRAKGVGFLSSPFTLIDWRYYHGFGLCLFKHQSE